jgi:hypothetical protein
MDWQDEAWQAGMTDITDKENAMDTTFEKHYSIKQLAMLWGFGVEVVRQEVLREADVVKRIGPSGKTSYRIPESVARRIHTRLITPRHTRSTSLRPIAASR